MKPNPLAIIPVIQQMEGDSPARMDAARLNRFLEAEHALRGMVLCSTNPETPNDLTMHVEVLRRLLCDAFEAGGIAALVRDRLAAMPASSTDPKECACGRDFPHGPTPACVPRSRGRGDPC